MQKEDILLKASYLGNKPLVHMEMLTDFEQNTWFMKNVQLKTYSS